MVTSSTQNSMGMSVSVCVCVNRGGLGTPGHGGRWGGREHMTSPGTA